MKRKEIILLAVAIIVAVGCASTAPARQAGRPIPIVVLPDVRDTTSPRRYVTLQLDYGLIISNGDTKSAPSYYLFCRDDKRIVKTHDANVFLAELEKLPDRATIDMVSKCSVPFYTQYGINIDEQYDAIMSLLKRKRCKLVSSLEDDERPKSSDRGARRPIFDARPRRGGRLGPEGPAPSRTERRRARKTA